MVVSWMGLVELRKPMQILIQLFLLYSIQLLYLILLITDKIIDIS